MLLSLVMTVFIVMVVLLLFFKRSAGLCAADVPCGFGSPGLPSRASTRH